jgi:transcriptional regulator with XRE-family HTH domain
MKSKTFFKEPLLISQEQMAMLLGVTRSQWSMVALGERGLPLKAKAKLDALVQNANKVTSAKRIKLVQEVQQENEMQKIIEPLLLDNALKLAQQQKKLSLMEEKYQKAVNTLHFVAGFQKESVHTNLLRVLHIKANKMLEANGLQHQVVCKIKIEVLEYEKKLLLIKMKSGDNDGLFKKV